MVWTQRLRRQYSYCSNTGANSLPVEHGHAHSAPGGCHARDEAPLARLRVPPEENDKNKQLFSDLQMIN